MENHKNEIRLVRDILNGKRDHYRVLVDRFAPMVFHIVNGFVDKEDDARELAQEIFVKTYERLPSFNEKSRFSSWLYMIAKNHCRDYAKNIRRKNKSFSEISKYDLEQQMEYQKAPDHNMETNEWIMIMREGLNKITSDYAEAFLMKYESGMTYKAMSSRLGVSESALKVRVYRAKKELKVFIEKNS
ncbi:MAG TPA: sigma-70 family RNA polymerase sigma factor [Balneolaceae bacterium]